MSEAPRINLVEFTVSELAAALKRTVEDAYAYVRVRGEISGFRGPHSSGHCYFALKDEGAKIDAVIWKGAFSRMRIKPEEGLEVIATGRLTTYPGRSTYQIVVEALEPAGLGALMALLEQRKKTLAAEGLFDEARKQLIPFLPNRIGVVTSASGAVIRDILHRLGERFPRPVLLWPVRVQGEGSAAEIASDCSRSGRSTRSRPCWEYSKRVRLMCPSIQPIRPSSSASCTTTARRRSCWSSRRCRPRAPTPFGPVRVTTCMPSPKGRKPRHMQRPLCRKPGRTISPMSCTRQGRRDTPRAF